MRAEFFRKLMLLATLALALLLGVACEDEENGKEETPPDPVALTREGWNRFESLNWEGALSSFEAAISAGATSTEAFSGAGWSYFMMGGNNQLARQRWTAGLTRTGGYNDIHFGFGSLAMLEDDFGTAIDHYDTIVANNPSYRFIHMSGVNIDDIYLALGQCHYNLGEFETALEYVQLLNPTFDADLTTPEGVAALSQELDRLAGIVG